ncbi:hypothetical protein C6P45_001911 [Maudiozyma exigua]|uniref:Uncharacterized protein n=1 Tax=Maudiozyma exigua TaxID=34358 RepID=A0A9P7B559_MAUEX|nr:hypothetical protein C6P45_001911 [Kazachstania exigua]
MDRFLCWLNDLDHHPLEKVNKASQNERALKTNVELEHLLNMVKIPIQIEKFMSFTLLASLDCFLYYFTILPMKIGINCFLYKDSAKRRLILRRTSKERAIIFLMITVTIVMSNLDTSKVYHKIKRQSAMKLYMLFNVLEIADKMLATIGQSLLSVLLSRRTYTRVRTKQLFLVFLTSLYLMAHTSVLIYQTVALNVAVNSYSNSLLTLLLSLQFAEIKSSVFKKFDKESLFQITMADSTERFKLLILVVIIMIRNFGTTPVQWNISVRSIFDLNLSMTVVSLPIFNIFMSEVIVDWIKHAYITKFNRIRPQIYDKFFYIMYRDYGTNQQEYQERLGLPILAYVTLSIVMLRTSLLHLFEPFQLSNISISLILTVAWFIILLSLRQLTHSTLLRWGQHIQTEWDLNENTLLVTSKDYVPGLVVNGMGKMDNDTRTIIHGCKSKKRSSGPIPADSTTKRDKLDLKQGDSLAKVTRYTMVSKAIW